jgi:hypothetical protein
LSLRVFCIHRGVLGQRVTARYTKNVTLRWIFTVTGLFEAVGPCVWGAGSAYQMPTSERPSNAQDAASGKSLAKSEKPLCLRHFGEHWLILWALSLTKNQGMFPVV